MFEVVQFCLNSSWIAQAINHWQHRSIICKPAKQSKHTVASSSLHVAIPLAGHLSCGSSSVQHQGRNGKIQNGSALESSCVPQLASMSCVAMSVPKND